MSAKEIEIKVITAASGNALCKKLHYSGKVVPNSQLHLGVFWKGQCHGVMQFGPPINKKATINLVKDTPWNGFIKLNRMAFDEFLPKNSESRALGVAHRLIKKTYPQIKWIISFADATQCGDGTIYRAAGYLLTGIKKNVGLRKNPETGEVLQTIAAHHRMIAKEFRTNWDALPGFQIRYVYFLDKEWQKNLTVPILDYSEIKNQGAKMYKGEKCTTLIS
jgi:hypothetical protein